MAYFPNGTSGELYFEQWCSRCKNWKQRADEDTEGCPIWDAHMLLNYDEKNEEALNALIPEDKDGNPLQCRMYDWNGEVRGQMRFTDNDS